jgi:hypothetical protein
VRHDHHLQLPARGGRESQHASQSSKTGHAFAQAIRIIGRRLNCAKQVSAMTPSCITISKSHSKDSLAAQLPQTKLFIRTIRPLAQPAKNLPIRRTNWRQSILQ